MAKALVVILIATLSISLLTACHREGDNQIDVSRLDTVGFTQTEVLELGQLVAAAYTQFDGAKDVANPAMPSTFVKGYHPFANLVAHDNKREKRDEFYGHLSWQESSDKNKTLVISIRGTSDFHEWVADAKFFKTPYNDNPAYGEVELGFKEVYSSFQIATPGSDQFTPIDEYLSGLTEIKNGELEKVIVVGHSLGSSLATLLAFDISTENYANTTNLLTFASPLTGDKTFVNSFNSNIKNSARIVNRPDIVTRVPPEAIKFEHVQHELEINSHEFEHIKRSVLCYHSVQTYLNILSDGKIALASKCQKNGEPDT